MSDSLLGYVRDEGKVGCRNHLLVLPSVVCATRVAMDIASSAEGVAIVHQHGCSQIGDDEVQTAAAFERVACNPNVGGVLVVSLGCETVQGREVARRIAERGQRVEFIGIQDSGGSDATVAGGSDLVRELAATVGQSDRRTIGADDLVVGIEASRNSEAAVAFARELAQRGASLVLGSAACLPEELAERALVTPAFGETLVGGDGAHLVLGGTRPAAEQHTALVAAGAQLIVSFPGEDEAPIGFPLCPVVAVAGSSELHGVLADEFDASETQAFDDVWRRIGRIFSGRPAAAELLGKQTFALSRLARSM